MANKKPVYILGISAFYHDSAACLVKDGEIMAAAQEERFTRKKHDESFPANSVACCLRKANIAISDVSYVAFYEKPFLKFDRLLLTYLSNAPAGLRSFVTAMPVWLKEKIFLKDLILGKLNYSGELLFPEHHESHAASAFFPSPFKEAAILTFDGVGEWTTTSYGTGKDNSIALFADIRFPHSLGLLYSAFTYYVGFRVNSGEYKLMGLAPYGEPKYAGLIKDNLIDIKPDGSFHMNMDYFNYCTGLTMVNERFCKLFGQPPRRPESGIQTFHMDIARSIQDVTEEIMVKAACHVHKVTKKDNLCLAGGVALNCVGNGKILKKAPFKNIWIQPAAGDAGGALGAALLVWHQYLGNARNADNRQDFQKGSFLGPDYAGEIEQFVQTRAFPHERLSTDALARRVAGLINDQKVIGIFQGEMEFGPRALGGRSIIGDARSQEMQTVLNLKTKFRESFRPFAPAVLEEKQHEYFDWAPGTRSPYMLLVAQVKGDKLLPDADTGARGLARLKVKRSVLPAVTHVDGSARVQTVSKETNPFFYNILREFDALTGCPVIINTSFNIRGEPIVCSPEDAYRCFMCTNMDYLLMGNFLFEKDKQPDKDKYKKEDISTIPD